MKGWIRAVYLGNSIYSRKLEERGLLARRRRKGETSALKMWGQLSSLFLLGLPPSNSVSCRRVSCGLSWAEDRLVVLIWAGTSHRTREEHGPLWREEPRIGAPVPVALNPFWTSKNFSWLLLSSIETICGKNVTPVTMLNEFIFYSP